MSSYLRLFDVPEVEPEVQIAEIHELPVVDTDELCNSRPSYRSKLRCILPKGHARKTCKAYTAAGDERAWRNDPDAAGNYSNGYHTGRPRLPDDYVELTSEQIAAGLTKRCAKCKRIWLKESMTAGGSWCKPCNRAWARARNTTERIRRSHLQRTYGITPEELEELWEAQGSRCPLCKASEVPERHVDHDHESGKIRGVLCGPCNRALGFFRDNVDAIRAAADYVESFRRAQQSSSSIESRGE